MLRRLFNCMLVLTSLAGITACQRTTNAQQATIAGIGPSGGMMKVKSGFHFTEGPAADRDGNVYFSDIPADRIYRMGLDGTFSVFRENTQKVNGSMFDNHGSLVSCSMASGRVVSFSPDGKEEQVLAAQYRGKRFNAPNDLVIDRAGGIYFTDPHYGAPEPWPQGIRTFYYIAPDKTVTRMSEQDWPAPNGIILSPDEKMLYLICTLTDEVTAFDVTAPGKLGPPRVFCRLKTPQGKKESGGDGLAIDTRGNLYITSTLGIQVIDSSGKALGLIEVPEIPANCTFGSKDRRMLYITAQTSIYAIRMESRGHQFAREEK